MNNSKINKHLVLIFLVLGSFTVIQGQDDEENTGWDFEITPYYWLSNIGGAQTLGRPVGENISGPYLISIHDDELMSDFAISTYGTRKKIGFGVEYYSSHLSNTDVSARYINNEDEELSLDYQWKSKNLSTMVRFGLTNPESVRFLEVYAGWRFYWQNQIVNVVNDPEVHISQAWSEPMLGIRFGTKPETKIGSRFYSGFGGFGVGSAYTWILGGEMYVKLTDFLRFNLRYHYHEYQYNNKEMGDARYVWDNAAEQGWLLGLMINLNSK